MRANRWNLIIGLSMLFAVVLGCNFSASTARIKSLKIAKDEEGNQVANTFKPGEKIYAIADIGNNPGKVKVTFRIVYDQVKGQEAGSPLAGAEKTLDVDGSRPAIFWVTLPASGFANGQYKVDVTMANENGEQKGQESATFNVEGFEEG